jgi:hypothetical protein
VLHGHSHHTPHRVATDEYEAMVECGNEIGGRGKLLQITVA